MSSLETVVIFKLTFRNVQRQIFAAHLVVAANDAALEDAPEALNRIGMDCADNVLPSAVIDNAVRVGVAKIFIRAIIAIAY